MTSIPPPGFLQARVKTTLSGDTIVLTKANNPKQERILSLAYVSSPRLKREGDEPFAFEAREFLRKSLVGRLVLFKVLYTIPTTKREYGILAIPQGPQFPDKLIAEGYAKLREDAGKKDESEEAVRLLEKLQALEARSKADSKGIWSESGGKIECAYELNDAKSFAEKNKGKSFEGVVEKVLTGDRLITRIFISPHNHTQTLILIAGIKTPATKKEDSDRPGEPFADEAHLFIESRLLQRNVQIEILGVSPQEQLIATIKHPTQGSIAPHILKAGYARCIDFHSTLLGAEMASLRQAEKEARDGKKGLFHGHVAKSTSSGESDVTVSRILSADTIFLRNKSGAEKRITLSSVRQPKPSDPKQSPFAAEAKEFLRKKLIGKHVKCQVNGKRAATEGYEEKEMATITQNGKNVALILVEAGYVSVIRHRHDDNDRSPIYDELLQAEQQAQQNQKGMWSIKTPTASNFIDYSENAEKAKRQMSILSRQKKVPGVVDFVKSGSRFTVLIPRDDAKITMVLSGIRAPKSARNANEKGEPFGQEAHDFANRRALQRDVEIDVDDVDKVGGFIGTLYVNRENFAKLLLEEGFASVHGYSAEKSGHASELFAAEKRAKEARKGLWQNWDPSADGEEEEEEEEVAGIDGKEVSNDTPTNGHSTQMKKKDDYRDVIVTHIDESGRLKLQQIGAGTSALEKLMSSFRSFHVSSKVGLSGPPKTGEVVAAKFSADGDWYRAKIRRNDRDKKVAEVVYIDYGNSETVPWSNLRPLGKNEFSITTLKGQATEASLSFTQLPGSAEYLSDAINWLARETEDRTLVASIDHIDSSSGLLSVTLYDHERSQSITDSLNADLIGEGLALVPRKLNAWEKPEGKILSQLKEREKAARESRKGMWEYGDISADD